MFAPFLRGALALAFVAATVAGCSDADLVGSEGSQARSERTWKLPTEVLAAGRQVRLTYDAAPAWTGRGACAGRLREGTRVVGTYLRDRFAAIETVGGYACRRNTAARSRMSVHGTGRALDLMIPKLGRGADSERGDAIANFLVTNAEKIGVQLIIWNRTVWRANGTNDAPYRGPHPHDDHIHLEVTNEGARRATAWFERMADGGVDEDSSAIAEAGIDAGHAEDDAGMADAGEPDSAIDSGPADAAAPDEEDFDAGTEYDEPAEGSEGEGADPGGPAEGYEFEVPEGEPAGDEDALAPKSKRNTAFSEDEVLESTGCSAAPREPSRGGFALFAAIALGVVSAARRRRASPSSRQA